MSDFYDKLREILTADSIREKEPMRNHTTFRIGGPAKYYAAPKSREQFIKAVGLCRREGMPFYVIGNGSNILVSDDGYEGMILSAECLTSWDIVLDAAKDSPPNREDAVSGVITAAAGVRLSRLAKAAAQKGLTGLEFAAGIPGTLGGAVVMNAGAYGSEMKDVLCWVQVLDGDGGLRRLTAQELHLGYRESCIPARGYVVLEAGLRLLPGQPEEICGKMEELARKRREKQPLEYPSAGSTFKRPKGHFAGKLIDEAGLRGFRVGDAQVSEKHCGFVVNRGNASAADVITLCDQVRRRVREATGVILEMEIKQL